MQPATPRLPRSGLLTGPGVSTVARPGRATPGPGRQGGGVLGGLFGWLIRWGLLLGLVVGLGLFLYGTHLDRVVRVKFEGKRWALPARVYARPLELYVGRKLSDEVLKGELDRLDYRSLNPPAKPGTYARQAGHFLIHTRPFRFWDGEEPERTLELVIADGKIQSLTDAGGGPAPILLRLDPALVASIYPAHNEDRVLLRRQDIPDLLVKALVAVEDRNFFEHAGLDPKAIGRAMLQNARAGAVVQGGSTLTQQLVKNFYLSQERTLVRKLNEALMAVLLDLRYPKDAILEAYANEIYLGQDGSRAIHGFGLASQFYFDRPVDQLGVPEIALLIALVKGPSLYDPRRHPERALERRNLVIDLMLEGQVLTAGQAEAAKRTPLGVRDGGGRPSGDFPSFLQLVRRQLQRDYAEADLQSEGLGIFTTLDPLVQAQAEKAVRERLPKLEKSKGMKAGTLESAAVVTSVAGGEVLAVVGGREASYAGFNRALDADRSIGSLIKPVVYLAALSQPDRYSLTSGVADAPVSLKVGNSFWQPHNYDGKSHGTVPLYKALAKSYNLATVNVGLAVGVKRIAELLQQLGVTRKIQVVPSLLLGATALSPLEVAQVYQTIAAGGFRAPLRAIREVIDAKGRPLNRYPLAVEQVAPSSAVFLTTWAMQQVVKQGTATALMKVLPAGMTVAGKTGTTDELRDSWFAGFSGDKVAVVWVGRDDNKPAGFPGGAGALPVWGDMMAVLENQPLGDVPPEGVTMGGCGNGAVPYIRAGGGPNCGGGGGGGGGGRAGGDADDGDSDPDPGAKPQPHHSDPSPKSPTPGPKAGGNPFLD
jgi:penicillin-binding protein 1B